MPQLWHVGMTRNPAKAPHPELPSAGPSDLTMPGFPGLTQPGLQHSEPMTRGHIGRVVDAFARGAADAQRLGFDGVERRCAAHRADFPIILRFSQWKQQDYAARLATTPEELARFLAPLSTAGVDIFHCSQRRFWEPEFEGSNLNLAGWTKNLTGKPTVTVGSVGLSGDFIGSLHRESSKGAGIDDLLDRLERNEFDLVAVGRALLVDPAWTRKVPGGPLRRAAALRARGARDTVLTPRAPESPQNFNLMGD